MKHHIMIARRKMKKKAKKRKKRKRRKTNKVDRSNLKLIDPLND